MTGNDLSPNPSAGHAASGASATTSLRPGPASAASIPPVRSSLTPTPAAARPWVLVAQALSEIQTLCREAHAAELRAAERARHRPSLADDDSMMPTPFGGADEPSEATVIDDTGANIVALRADLRTRLVDLKTRLSESRTEQEVYYALFPLVVFADELAQAATAGRAGAWPPLQTELYDIYNGGERFFTTIETLLKREETSPLVFEVFYLCLSAGFLGQFQNNPGKIEEYKARLAFRIPVETPSPESERAEPDVEPVKLVDFPAWYYAAAAALVAGSFGLMHALARVHALPSG